MVDECAVVHFTDIGRKFHHAHFLHHGDVEQSVIGNSMWHHHHATSVESAIAHRNAQNLVFQNLLAVDLKLDVDAFELEQAACRVEQITHGASFALRLQLVGATAYHLVQSGSRGIQKIPHPGVAIVVVDHLADIVRQNVSVFDDVNHLGVFLREIESTSPIIAGPHRDGSHRDFGSWETLLGENAINDLVIGPISSHGNDFLIAFFGDMVSYQLDGMTGTFCRDKIKIDTLLCEQILDDRPVFFPSSNGCLRIHHNQPLAVFFVHRFVFKKFAPKIRIIVVSLTAICKNHQNEEIHPIAVFVFCTLDFVQCLQY